MTLRLLYIAFRITKVIALSLEGFEFLICVYADASSTALTSVWLAVFDDVAVLETLIIHGK